MASQYSNCHLTGFYGMAFEVAFDWLSIECVTGFFLNPIIDSEMALSVNFNKSIALSLNRRLDQRFDRFVRIWLIKDSIVS